MIIGEIWYCMVVVLLIVHNRNGIAIVIVITMIGIVIDDETRTFLGGI